jgi:hypothetical protein
MTLIKIVIASLFLVFYFIEMTRLPEKLKLNFKPFNCSLCLSFYVAIILYLVPNNILNCVLVASVSGVAAPLFRNLMMNIFFKKS